jgi:thymidylate kinase
MTLLFKAVLIAGHRRRGRLVLLDRYTLDADLPSDSLDLKGRISAKLARRTNAEPDLMLLLDGPVELMYARKGEHGVAELQVRRDAYLAMAKRLPQMVIIDAQQSRDEVRWEATEFIWERWSQRNGSRDKAAAARGATVTGARRAATEKLPAGSTPSSRERT